MIPCHNCDCTYIGETGRNYGKRQKEHIKEVEPISNRTFAWSDRKSRAAEMNKSAITDHVAKENHVINWSGAKILESQGHRKTMGRSRSRSGSGKKPNCMNRDGGACRVLLTDSLYDRLSVTCSTSRDHKPDEARRWRAKRRD